MNNTVSLFTALRFGNINNCKVSFKGQVPALSKTNKNKKNAQCDILVERTNMLPVSRIVQATQNFVANDISFTGQKECVTASGRKIIDEFANGKKIKTMLFDKEGQVSNIVEFNPETGKVKRSITLYTQSIDKKSSGFRDKQIKKIQMYEDGKIKSQIEYPHTVKPGEEIIQGLCRITEYKDSIKSRDIEIGGSGTGFISELTDYNINEKVHRNIGGKDFIGPCPILAVAYNSDATYTQNHDLENFIEPRTKGTISKIQIYTDSCYGSIGDRQMCALGRNFVSTPTNIDDIIYCDNFDSRNISHEIQDLARISHYGTDDKAICDKWIEILKKYTGITDEHIDAASKYNLSNQELLTSLIGDGVRINEDGFLFLNES